MRKILFIILMTVSINANTQNDSILTAVFQDKLSFIYDRIQKLESENSRLKIEILHITIQLKSTKDTIESLKSNVEKNKLLIEHSASKANHEIEFLNNKTNNSFNLLSLMLRTHKFYGIIGVLSAILLSGLLYWLLSKRQQTDKNQLSNIINNTKTELTQESAKLDIQLLDVIEKQLKVADKLNATEPTIDHTFHKNSANELQRIANYANTLAPESQEAIALQGSLGRLRNYFNASDYEITDFTGKEYDERIPMRIRETIFDDSIALGKEIVIKTWEPQIKFKNEIIQKAKIDTKYNK